MSNNTSERSNDPLDEPVGSPLDTKLDSPIGETEDERSPTVDLDEL